MTDETMREGLARAMATAVRTRAMKHPGQAYSDAEIYADAAMSYLASRGGDVGEVVAELRQAVDDRGEGPDVVEQRAADLLTAQAAALEKVTEERDALREALREMIEAFGRDSGEIARRLAMKDARAALSRDADESGEAGDA